MVKVMKLLCMVLAAALALFSGTPASGQPPLVIGIQCYNRECHIPELEAVLAEAYSRIGQAVDFRYFPPGEVIGQTISGKLDGCGVMTKAALTGHSGLALVESPISRASLVAFSMDRNVESVTSWNDLAGSTLGVLKGTILLQDSPLHELPVTIRRVGAPPEAFRMLDDGALDYVLGDITAGSFLARKMGIRIYTSGSLGTANLYHAVRTPHANLIPALETTLDAMLMDGSLLDLLGKYKTMIPTLPTVQ